MNSTPARERFFGLHHIWQSNCEPGESLFDNTAFLRLFIRTGLLSPELPLFFMGCEERYRQSFMDLLYAHYGIGVSIDPSGHIASATWIADPSVSKIIYSEIPVTRTERRRPRATDIASFEWQQQTSDQEVPQ